MSLLHDVRGDSSLSCPSQGDARRSLESSGVVVILISKTVRTLGMPCGRASSIRARGENLRDSIRFCVGNSYHQVHVKMLSKLYEKITYSDNNACESHYIGG